MGTNEGVLDRGLRITIGLVALVAGLGVGLGSVASIVLLVVAATATIPRTSDSMRTLRIDMGRNVVVSTLLSNPKGELRYRLVGRDRA